jgi:soluble lytic murein transglycosylase-like protein
MAPVTVMRLPMLFLIAISLLPATVSPALRPYQHSCRQQYCPEYYAKQKVKDFILIYAWPRMTLLEAWGIAACVVDNAERYALPYGLIASVAMVESRFNYEVINHMNCYGLMQVRPFYNDADVWLDELRREEIITVAADLLRPEYNVRAGCYILAKYLRQYGDLPTALSRYSGSTKPVNDEYVRRVFDAMEYFKG